MQKNTTQIVLNESQQEGYDKLNAFLLTSDKYFILSGGPGTGKSTLINYMSENLMESFSNLSKILGDSSQSQNYLTITATTNSAADSLKKTIHTTPVQTIHSCLGLMVRNGSLVMTRPPHALKDAVLVIDEYTLIDNVLFEYIDRFATKVILVGDADQLLAVKGLASYLKGRQPNHVLDIPERTKSPDILKVVEIFKGYVKDEYEPEDLDLTGMVDVSAISDDEFVGLIHDPDTDFSNSRILTHTNADVIGINQAIRFARGLPKHFVPGERVTLNKYVNNGSLNFKTDSEYTIVDHVEDTDKYWSSYSYVIEDKWGVRYKAPYKVDEISEDLFVGGPPSLFDLRALYSSTVYKAQGRSEDTVYLHLSGFPNNVSRSVLVRSLYVGASRARKELIFVGDLSTVLLGKL